MIASTQITNTEIFAFTTTVILKLLSRKVLFINRKDNRNRQKVGYFLRKYQILRVNYCKIVNSWNVRILLKNVSSHFISAFSICMTVPLNSQVFEQVNAR